MTRSVVQQLVLKDLYLSRWIVLGSMAAGAVALVLSPLSTVAFYVGMVAFICVLVILNIFLVMSGVAQERKDKVALFVLSLPISTTQYTTAKITANLTAFAVPWLLLTALAVIVIDRSAIPNGLIPVTVAISSYLLLYYCALLTVALTSDSAGALGAGIVAGNVSVNFVVPFVLRLPSVAASGAGPTAVWSTDILTVIIVELACAALALALGFVLQSRRTDFI